MLILLGLLFIVCLPLLDVSFTKTEMVLFTAAPPDAENSVWHIVGIQQLFVK